MTSWLDFLRSRRRRKRERMAATLACIDAEMDGMAVHIRCLDCPAGTPDYDGTYPLTGMAFESWAKTHAGHPVAMTAAGDKLPPVVLPS